MYIYIYVLCMYISWTQITRSNTGLLYCIVVWSMIMYTRVTKYVLPNTRYQIRVTKYVLPNTS